MLQTVEEEMAHGLDTQEDAPLIRIKIRAVERGHCFLIGILDTQEEEKSRYFLTIVREILGHQLRFYLLDLTLAQEFDKGGKDDLGQLRVIVNWRNTSPEVEGIIGSEGPGDPSDDILDGLRNPLSVLLTQSPDSAFEKDFVGDDIGSSSAPDFTDRDHSRIRGVCRAADDGL